MLATAARADSERHGYRAVYADAHKLRGILVLGHGAHRFTETGLVDKQRKRNHYHCGHREGEDGHAVYHDLAELYRGDIDDSGKCHRLGFEHEKSKALEEVAHADGGDKNCERLRLAQGAVSKEFYRYTKENAYDDAYRHAYNAGQLCQRDRGNNGISAHHDYITVGKVKHFGYSVHHSVPQRHESVYAP